MTKPAEEREDRSNAQIESAPKRPSAMPTSMRVRTPSAFDFRWSRVRLANFVDQPELAAVRPPVERGDGRDLSVLDLDEFVLSNLMSQPPPNM